MGLPPPLTSLTIARHQQGYLTGFNGTVTWGSKILVGLLILTALVFPTQVGTFLDTINRSVLTNFGAWYIWLAASSVLVCLALALWPPTGKIRLGRPNEQPEFSNFSWFAMMFGAGIGVGMLTYSTAEPIAHLSQNPDILQNFVSGETAETVRSAYKWSFFHWGFTPWGIYAIVGLSLGYFGYTRNLPLTVRSGLAPIFGEKLNSWVGHSVDIIAVIATVLGVAVTVGFGVSQLSVGVHALTTANWMVEDGAPTNEIMLLCLVAVMGASMWSAASGVDRGIKWLSNLNMGMTIFLLGFFAIFGATLFAIEALSFGLVDYVIALPEMMFTVWQGTDMPAATALSAWQADWTIFYWAWWISFAPFVGLFIARVSRGRTIREFILGAILLPSLMCFLWFSLVGGTAIDLELFGDAGRVIIDAGQSERLFALLSVMLSPVLFEIVTGFIVLLLMTYLVTSADSAILTINTINSGGTVDRRRPSHAVFWGSALTVIIGSLLYAGGLSAIQSVMVIGALPFSLIMALMTISLIAAIIGDAIRSRGT